MQATCAGAGAACQPIQASCAPSSEPNSITDLQRASAENSEHVQSYSLRDGQSLGVIKASAGAYQRPGKSLQGDTPHASREVSGFPEIRVLVSTVQVSICLWTFADRPTGGLSYATGL